jgi:F1F0 ATPase subunit 2
MTIAIGDALLLALALLVGAGLGLFFFGGLWLTLRRLPTARRPALLVFGSLFIRLIVTVFGFYLVMGGSWERLIACMVGFILMRLFLVRRLVPGRTNTAPAER